MSAPADFTDETNEEEEEVSSVVPRKIEDSLIWRIWHWMNFFLGAGTTIFGSVIFALASTEQALHLAAFLYTVGSCGFLVVDITEFFTFRSDVLLRINIFFSVVGSLLYVIGCVGFLPEFGARINIGIWGFILGSAVLGISQLWKLHRVLFRCEISPMDRFTAIGVEVSVGLGAFFFLVGMVMYHDALGNRELEGQLHQDIVNIWIGGSFFFTQGSVFIAWRHFVLPRAKFQ